MQNKNHNVKKLNRILVQTQESTIQENTKITVVYQLRVFPDVIYSSNSSSGIFVEHKIQFFGIQVRFPTNKQQKVYSIVVFGSLLGG